MREPKQGATASHAVEAPIHGDVDMDLFLYIHMYRSPSRLGSIGLENWMSSEIRAQGFVTSHQVYGSNGPAGLSDSLCTAGVLQVFDKHKYVIRYMDRQADASSL